MKLTLTQSEASNLIARHYNVDNVEIVDNPRERLNLVLMDFVSEAVRFDRPNKINAIKAVRDLGDKKGFAIGLADAKFFVESFPRFS